VGFGERALKSAASALSLIGDGGAIALRAHFVNVCWGWRARSLGSFWGEAVSLGGEFLGRGRIVGWGWGRIVGRGGGARSLAF